MVAWGYPRGGQARRESIERKGNCTAREGRGLEMADGFYIYLFKGLNLTGPSQGFCN